MAENLLGKETVLFSGENQSAFVVIEIGIKPEPELIIKNEDETERIPEFVDKTDITEEDQMNLIWHSCAVCEERFLSIEDLSLHNETHMKSEEAISTSIPDNNETNPENDFECSQSQIKTDTKEERYKCDRCDYSFSVRRELLAHNRMHRAMAGKAIENSNWIQVKEKKSKVWSHLLMNSKHKNLLKCKHCDTTFKAHQATTSYRYHMEHKHNLFRAVPSTSTSTSDQSKNIPDSTKITTISSNQNSPSPYSVLANLTALDRISFATLANSKEIRNGWEAQGLKMPLTEKGIKEDVMQYAEQLQKDLKTKIKFKIEARDRFSLTLDEWTSKRNRRYICLNIHSKDSIFGLGMIRIEGAMPAIQALEIVNYKLQEYDIDLKKHIVAVVTDSTSVMKKMGSLIGIYHQLCHSHGIHLAVVDVLYKRLSSKTNLPVENESQQTFEKSDEEFESGEDEDDTSNEIQTWNDKVDFSKFTELDLVQELSGPVQKVRKIAKLFRRSPVKNESLQKECQTKMGKQLTLIIDSSTRWNSMLAMLRRFCEMKAVIQKVLTDLTLEDMFPNQNELIVISELAEALEVIEVSSLALGRKDCNLLQASKIFEFLINKLKEQSSELGQLFYNSITKRINERRNVNLEGLLLYLEDPISYLELLSEPNSVFKWPTKKELANTAKEISDRLMLSRSSSSDSDVQDESDCNDSDENKNESKKPKYSKADELQHFLSKKYKKPTSSTRSSTNNLTDIKRQMMVLEHSKIRTDLLDKIYNSLLTIPPSSVEAERCFNAAGLFVTKLQTSLNDETLDKLFFLRAHLLNNV